MIDETGKVTFNEQEQAVVDKVIQDRLAREQGKYADHEDYKAITDELKSFGYEGTPREIREAVKAQREANQKQAELEALKHEATHTGTSPELLAEMKALKAELNELKKPIQAQTQAEEAKKVADIAWQAQVSEFDEKHPEIDRDKLSKNEDFLDFLTNSNPTLSLTQVYERFEKLIGKASADAMSKIKSNLERSTSSGRAKGDPTGGTYGLSSTQQDLAKKAGMSLKEYSDLMKDIT